MPLTANSAISPGLLAAISIPHRTIPKLAAEKTMPALRGEGFSWVWENVPFEKRYTRLPDRRYPPACDDHIFYRGLRLKKPRSSTRLLNQAITARSRRHLNSRLLRSRRSAAPNERITSSFYNRQSLMRQLEGLDRHFVRIRFQLRAGVFARESVTRAPGTIGS